MANYYGAARTNYVKVSDMDGLKEFLKDWPIEIDEHEGKTAFFSADGDSGGWPMCRLDENDEDVDFDFGELMVFIEPGEVLVFMEAGAEKLRYLVGFAYAYMRDKDGNVSTCSISIQNIFKKAAEKFGVKESEIDDF